MLSVRRTASNDTFVDSFIHSFTRRAASVVLKTRAYLKARRALYIFVRWL